jgi:hypothetical protein
MPELRQPGRLQLVCSPKVDTSTKFGQKNQIKNVPINSASRPDRRDVLFKKEIIQKGFMFRQVNFLKNHRVKTPGLNSKFQ